MHVAKFELCSPDSDGDMAVDCEVIVDNPTQENIRLIRTSTAYVNKEGLIFACNTNNDRDDYLGPGENIMFDPGTGYAKVKYCGDARDDVRVRVFAALYSREFSKLGEIEVPASHKHYTTLRKTVTSSVIDPEIAIIVSRSKPDDDGDIGIEIHCGILNRTDNHIDKILLKTELLDNEDEVINTDESQSELAPHAVTCIESSFWGLRKNHLRGARCRCSLSVFVPVHRETCEATSTSSDG